MTTSDIASLAWAQTWQLTLLIVVVAALARLVCRRRPHLAHVLWLVVLAKCLTPPLIASTGSVFCWLQPARTTTVAASEAPEFKRAAISNEGPRSFLSALADPSAFATDRNVRGSQAAPILPAVESPLPITSIDNPTSATDRLASRFSDWRRWGGGLWLLGSSALISVAVVRWAACLRQVRRAPIEPRPDLDALVATLSRRLRVGRRVRLLVTGSRIGPAVVGLFRPTILLPTAIVQGKSPRELEAILAHELIHVRRGDLWTGVVQVIAQGVWWFHPLVWLANRRATRAAEACCDEEVIAELRCDPAAYAGSLLEVLELKRRLISVPAFPGMRPVDVTRERLERIMQLGQGCRCATPWWCWIVLVVTAAATLPGAAFVVSADDEAKPPAPALPADAKSEKAAGEAADAKAAQPQPATAASGEDSPSERQDAKSPSGDTTEKPQIGSALRTDVELHSARIGDFKVSIVHTKRSPIRIDPNTKNLKRSRVEITFSPVDSDKTGAQTMRFAAQKILTGSNDFVEGESPLQFDLEGTVIWSLGDVTASAQRGKLRIVPSDFSQNAPHSKAFITLELSGESRWSSEALEADTATVSAAIGLRGSRAEPRIGLYELSFGRAAEVHFARSQLQGDDFDARADRAKLMFFDPSNDWPPLNGDSITGQPLRVELSGNARLIRRSLLGRSTVTGEDIHVEGRHGGDPFNSISVSDGIRRPSRRKTKLIQGAGVNSGAGLVGTVVLAEAEKVEKGKPAAPAANEAADVIMSTVTYSVADLIIPQAPLNLTIWPTEDAKPENPLKTPGEHYRDGDRAQQLLSGKAALTRDEKKADFAPLVELIQAMTGQAHWDEFGGSGSIRPFTTTLSLVVRNTQQVHDEIAGLLGQLRKLRDLRMQLDLEIFYFPGGSKNVAMPDCDLTEAAKRGLDPSNDQVDALRKIVAEGKDKWVHETVKFTLYNGQGAELALRRLWGAGDNSERPPLMQINPVISADRSAVRLHIAVGAASAVDALARSHTLNVKDRRPLLLDVTDDIISGRLGLPVVDPLVRNRALLKALSPEHTRGWPQVLLLITPEIIVHEEQEEVLNINQP